MRSHITDQRKKNAPRAALPIIAMGIVALTHASTALAASSCTGLSSPTLSPAVVCGLTETLAADAYNGRFVGTQQDMLTRAYLITELSKRGVKVAGAPGTGYIQQLEVKSKPVSGQTQTTRQVYNLIGIYDPKNTGGAPTVLLSAHYDGIEPAKYVSGQPVATIGFCKSLSPDTDKICNAAADNITGVTTILGILDAIKGKLTAPIAIAFWDGEEDHSMPNALGGSLDVGLLGSNYFAKNPTFDTTSLRLHINLESLGFNSFEGMENHLFVLGSESGGQALSTDVANALAAQTNYPLDVSLGEYALGQKRVDLEGFVRRDWPVPYLMVGNGGTGLYHSSGDDAAHVNWKKVLAVGEAMANLTVKTAQTNPKYPYLSQSKIPQDAWLYDKLYLPSYGQLDLLMGFLDKAKLSVVAARDKLGASDSRRAEYEVTLGRLDKAKTKLQGWKSAGTYWWSINALSAVSWLGPCFQGISTEHAQALAAPTTYVSTMSTTCGY